MKLRIVATGGTFDKHYDALKGELGFSKTHLFEIIERVRLNDTPTIESLALMDSLDMKEPDRLRILSACRASPETGIVVIHGTDTMPETAGVLAQEADLVAAKTIVLTGAMVPYEVAGSDALFNFGFACAVALTLRPGVYVAMNGQVFDGARVRKDRAIGRFVAG